MHFVTFVTLFVGIFDSTTRTFIYCNAGHNPPIVLQQNGVGKASIVWLDPTGAAIGLVEESEYAQRTLSLHEGDLLVMYTDGVTEAADPQGEMFGGERLAGVVERMYQSPPREVVSGIREDLEGHTDGRPLADDATVIVCRIT
jgi:sigma-B regulation protein RsbU (phosphoserine phosphatase)